MNLGIDHAPKELSVGSFAAKENIWSSRWNEESNRSAVMRLVFEYNLKDAAPKLGHSWHFHQKSTEGQRRVGGASCGCVQTVSNKTNCIMWPQQQQPVFLLVFLWCWTRLRQEVDHLRFNVWNQLLPNTRQRIGQPGREVISTWTKVMSTFRSIGNRKRTFFKVVSCSGNAAFGRQKSLPGD